MNNYTPLCPEYDPPKNFRSKTLVPRPFWTSPDRLSVLCESVLRRLVVVDVVGHGKTKTDFWTVIENLMPPIGRIHLRHHLNDTESRQRDYLNHWDRLTLDIARKTNPQLRFPKTIIGRQQSNPVQLESSCSRKSSLNDPHSPIKIKCSIKAFKFCEIQVQRKSK